MSTNNEETKRVIYSEHYAAFRALNQQMWQVPALAMTLTGGLWFGASEITNDLFLEAALLFLAGVGNGAFAIALWRVRFIMGEILNTLNDMYPEHYVDASTGKSFITTPKIVVKSWVAVLIIAMIISIVFSAIRFWSQACS